MKKVNKGYNIIYTIGADIYIGWVTGCVALIAGCIMIFTSCKNDEYEDDLVRHPFGIEIKLSLGLQHDSIRPAKYLQYFWEQRVLLDFSFLIKKTEL